MVSAIEGLKVRISEVDEEIKVLEGNLAGLPEPLTVRWRDVNCGKECSSDPNHGPYAYGYKWVNGVMIEKYIGKNGELANAHAQAMQVAKDLKSLITKRAKYQRELELRTAP